MDGQPTCRHEDCPVEAEETVQFLGQPRLYCSFHAHRARQHLEGDVEENVRPDTEVRDGLHREADDSAAHVYPFDDEDRVGNGFLGRRIGYGETADTVRISMEYVEDSPHEMETVTVEQPDLPELVAGLAERARPEHHEELRERFEAALERAPYEEPMPEESDDGLDVEGLEAGGLDLEEFDAGDDPTL